MGVEVTKLQAEDDQQDAKLMARVWTGMQMTRVICGDTHAGQVG
jgi:hypothetical protein